MSHRTAFSAQALAVLAALAARPSAWRHGYDLARRGWFGPVRGSITARLVRVAGCVAICGLGVAVVRMDSHLGLRPSWPGPVQPAPRDRRGSAAWRRAGRASPWARPDGRMSTPTGCGTFIAGTAGLLIFAVVPLQAIAIVYVAGILAATSRRSPVANASLAASAMAGLAAGLAVTLAAYGLATPDDRYVGLMVLGMLVLTFLLAALAGVAAAWLLSGTGTRRSCERRGSGRDCSRARWPELPAACWLTNFFVGGRVHDGHRPAARRGWRRARRRRRG